MGAKGQKIRLVREHGVWLFLIPILSVPIVNHTFIGRVIPLYMYHFSFLFGCKLGSGSRCVRSFKID